MRVLAPSVTLGLLLAASPAAALCPNPAAVIPGTTSTGYYFLSQIGGCSCLPSFLAALGASPHAHATLVIDGVCTLTQTLTLPRRMTLAGVGIEGQGVLSFPGLTAGQAAIAIGPQQVPQQDAYVTIRDLNIVGPGSSNRPLAGYGLSLVHAHLTRLENVRMSGFSVGVRGEESYSVWISRSNISNNGTNVRVGEQCNGWRVRDNVLSRATGWGVYVTAASEYRAGFGSNDLLLDGNRMESNGQGAVRLGSYGAMLVHNRFESNNALGVLVDGSASSSRLLTNVFSTDVVVDLGVDTVCAYSIGNPGC